MKEDKRDNFDLMIFFAPFTPNKLIRDCAKNPGTKYLDSKGDFKNRCPVKMTKIFQLHPLAKIVRYSAMSACTCTSTWDSGSRPLYGPRFADITAHKLTRVVAASRTSRYIIIYNEIQIKI